MLLDSLGASLLGDILTDKGINRAGEGHGQGIVRPGYGCNSRSKKELNFFFRIHPLTNIDIKRYYQRERRFINVYSHDNLPNKIKDGDCIINLDEHSDIGTHWIALYIQNNEFTYFDSFAVEHIPKEIRTFIINKNIKTNIFRIQAYDSIMCGYFYTRFIDFMLTGKTLTDFTNIFSANNF